MRITVLGVVEAFDDAGTPLPLPAGNATVLLLALAVSAGRPVPAGRLADVLWGAAPPATAGNAVQVYVRRLRRRLGDDAVVTAADGYALGPAVEVDLPHVEALLAEAAQARRSGAGDRAVELLDAALERWPGPLGGVHGDAPWLLAERSRLEAAREQAVLDRLDALVGIGRPGEALPDLLPLAATHPLDERLQSLLVLALAAAGRRDEALAAYRRVRTALREELGLDPGDLLEDAHAVALQAPAGSRPAGRGAAPSPMHPIVGREDDLDAVRDLLLGDARLVTVTGPGGVGKTRLALALAAQLARSFDDGAVWVPLSELTDPADVPAAIGSALGLWDVGPDVLDVVAAHLRDQHLLLVVDNLEHLPAAAPVVTRLLAACEGLRCLVTSRTVLRVHGEHQHALAPLAVPDDVLGPAERLFWSRVRAVRSDLPADPGPHRPAVQEICRSLDGLPLALELAAARAAVLPLVSIAAQLRAAPADLQATGVAAADPADRHRSLRELVRWSTDLLPAQDRRLLGRLSVFRGGCTLDAAVAVGDHDGSFGGRVVDVVAELRDASLVTLDGQDPSRLRMLVMIRECAQDLLPPQDRGPLQRAHARHLADTLAATMDDRPRHIASVAQARAGAAELDNLRAALSAARDAGDTPLLADLVAALAPVGDVSGRAGEVVGWLDVVDAAPGRAVLPAARSCDLHLWRSRLARDVGAAGRGLESAQASLAAARESADPERVVMARILVAYWLAYAGDPQALAHEDAVAAHLATAAGPGTGMLLALLGMVALQRGAHDTATDRLQQALVLMRDLDEELHEATAVGWLSEVMLLSGRGPEAVALLAPWDFAALADVAPHLVAYPLGNRVTAALLTGDPARAAADLPLALDLAERGEDVVLRLDVVRAVVAVAAGAGAWADALHLLAGFARHAEPLRAALEASSGELVVAGIADRAAAALPGPVAEAARRAGAAADLATLWRTARRVVREHLAPGPPSR
ncbi:BTAD domain-containing putative transcriptional regulator [Kineosporia sp. A_224]|uniref:ATP-binding protein n=1 Tax=Kineosporia sp. A_224 TaxID=1962180 RepID=UPI001304485D|nr:BTAD domain-containing putative transcriptional regulator [Kineosporia sp. A_224]